MFFDNFPGNRLGRRARSRKRGKAIHGIFLRSQRAARRPKRSVSCARPQRVHPSTALIYRGRGAGAPGRCVPVKPGSVIGRKRGVFGPLFGKPAEKTRPFEQTRKAHPRNFPPVPTSRSATETEPFRPDPLPPVFEFWPPPGRPGIRRKPADITWTFGRIKYSRGWDPPGESFVFF